MPRVFLLLLAIGVAFVWWTSGRLPDVVAAHFGVGGAADRFVPRGEYMAAMLALVLCVPALLGSLAALARRLPVRFVHVPNPEFRLAPERRAATLDAIGSFGRWAAPATLVLLCAVHWFVIRANAARPPHLEQTPLIGLMAVYFVALFVGMIAVLTRFVRAR